MDERQQIKFSLQAVSYRIDDMLDQGKTQLFYSKIFPGDFLSEPGVLSKHILDVVVRLQMKYRGLAVVSRTPGGIVVHKI